MNPHFTLLFRRVFRLIIVALGGLGWAAAGAAAAAPSTVEQWNGFELALAGPAAGNPFTEVEVSARFTQGERTVQIAGFYDGDGVFVLKKRNALVADKDGRSVALPGRPYLAVRVRRQP